MGEFLKNNKYLACLNHLHILFQCQYFNFIFSGLNIMWLGGHDMTLEDRLEWITGECSFSFDDWLAGQPNDCNGEGDCLMLNYSDDGWNDDRCWALWNFVCEFR